MKTRVIAALSAALGFALLVVRPAVGQQPLVPEGPEAGVRATATDMDGGAPSAPPNAPPTPPPGYMLVPIPPDGGAPDGSAPVNGATIAAAANTSNVQFRYANTWDLNIEGGGGYVFGDTDKWTGFVRARPGVLFVRNDSFYQLGATAEYLGMLKRPAFGVQAEYLHLQLGAWIQAGGSIDTKGRPGAMAAVGLSIFGIEGQVREFDASPDPAFAVIGKIRLPLGILVYGLMTRK